MIRSNGLSINFMPECAGFGDNRKIPFPKKKAGEGIVKTSRAICPNIQHAGKLAGIKKSFYYICGPDTCSRAPFENVEKKMALFRWSVWTGVKSLAFRCWPGTLLGALRERTKPWRGGGKTRTTLTTLTTTRQCNSVDRRRSFSPNVSRCGTLHYPSYSGRHSFNS